MKKEVFLSAAIGIILGFIGGTVLQSNNSETQNPIEAYYTNAAATLVSPHHLRQEMDKGADDFILVDLRTEAEYQEEHIVGAINIDASLTREEIVERFRELELEEKEVIIYCYSAACMTGRKVGAMLASGGVYVKEMTIGWNEWRYDFMSWNYPSEWEDLDPSMYIVSGSEPGALTLPEGLLPSGCDIEGEFGC